MAIYPWENAVLTWQHREDLESATIKFYRGSPEKLLLCTHGDTMLYTNENYINRLTHRVSNSTISYTLQEVDDNDVGLNYGVEVYNDINFDARLIIYCECYTKVEIDSIELHIGLSHISTKI